MGPGVKSSSIIRPPGRQPILGFERRLTAFALRLRHVFGKYR